MDIERCLKHDAEKKLLVIEIVSILAIFIGAFSILFNIRSKEKYIVSFNSVGGTCIASQKITSHKEASKPADPIKKGYLFVGWYYNDELYDFNNSINSDLVLEAHWEKIED